VDALQPQALTIFEVAELHKIWQADSAATVDLSQVAEVDAAGLQLLLHWQRSEPQTLSFVQPSEALCRGAETLNLIPTLWPQEVADE